MKVQKGYMIFDMQYGSTGKGLLAGYLARRMQPDVVVTAWAPNAGHTYIDEKGRKYVHRMLANGVVSPKLTHVLLGAGSAIDLTVLLNELRSCSDHMRGKSLIIHPHAAIVTQEHVDIEKRNVKIGSTMKGTGAAYIQRIERDPDNQNVALTSIPEDWIVNVQRLGIDVSISYEAYQRALGHAHIVQIEGAQGFSLSMYHGFYPHTTSRDVTPAQVLADCCIPGWMDIQVLGTLRTLPIRVSNRKVDSVTGGTIEYSSGPAYPDQREIEWSELGMEPELTTVTKLPRRIFSFSMMQLEDAVFQCNPDVVFLNFANYLKEDELRNLIDSITAHVPVKWVGFGPLDTDIKEVIYTEPETGTIQ